MTVAELQKLLSIANATIGERDARINQLEEYIKNLGNNIPEHTFEEKKKEDEGMKEEEEREEEVEEEEKIEVSPFSVKEKEEASAKKMAEESEIFNERVINCFFKIMK